LISGTLLMLAGWVVSHHRPWSLRISERVVLSFADDRLTLSRWFSMGPLSTTTADDVGMLLEHVRQLDGRLFLFWHSGSHGFIGVSLWLPCTLLLVAACLSAGPRRQILPDHCRCGYNLTGNVSGVCPECGTPVTEQAASVSKGPTS
jgi:hypothetical protein